MSPVPHLSLLEAAIAVLVVTVGSAVQAAVGIGLALLSVPVLALIDIHFVPGPMLMAGVIVALCTALRDREAIHGPDLTFALAGLAAGTLAGAAALKIMTGTTELRRLFGALVLLAIAISLLRPRVEPTRRALLLGGTASGVMGTMIGIHGPPISLVFQNARPELARSLLGGFFAVAYCGTLLVLAISGLFGAREIELGVLLIPGSVAGLAIAPHIVRLVDKRRLRIAILVISGISGALLLH
jgi:uncharacterized protein